MNFFAHQDQARRKSFQLVALFALAVIGIVAGVNLVLLLALGAGDARQAEQARPLMAVAQDNLPLFGLVSLLILGTIVVASLTRIAKLRQGGRKVAEMLGAEPVSPETRDPLERRLLNVVEEIALASGTPVPGVFVLREEPGINAFAAGHSPGDAAVAVTRGTLETLSRRELQGVIAHEISHIVNGDMRLSTRLIGVLFGILVLTVIGRLLLHGARFRGGGRGGQGAAAIMVAALALLLLGYVGVFFGRLIKAGVSRQRESLADASAVQFTREPEGLAGALKKIGAAQGGSAINSPEAEEVSHMLFGPGFKSMSSLLATHPPILERIQAIEPHFDEQEFKRFSERWQREQAAEQQREAAREEQAKGPPLDLPGLGPLPGGGAIDPTIITGLLLADLSTADRAAGTPAAARLLAELPKPLYDAVHTRGEAASAVAYLLLSDEAEIRERQIEAAAQVLGDAAARRLREWSQAGLRAAAEQRLPLLELAVPTLRLRSAEELAKIAGLIQTLIHADGRVSVFEYALGTLFRAHLRDLLEPARRGAGGRRRLADCLPAIQTILSVAARVGAHGETEAAAAYAAGIARLALPRTPDYAYPEDWAAALNAALETLAELKLPQLERLVAALGETIVHNQRVSLQEFELLRALCGALQVPVPPLLPAAEQSATAPSAVRPGPS